MKKETSSQLSASSIGTVIEYKGNTSFLETKTILDLLPTQDAIMANKGLVRDSRA